MASKQGRGGLTLLEVLAVMAIVAILVALLIPAVQRIRLAGDRTTASNQLRQIILATHGYADANAGKLPAFRSLELMNRPVAGFRGVFGPILPYVDASKVVLEYTYNNGPTLTYVPFCQSPLDPSIVEPLSTSLRARPGTISFAANYQVFCPGATLPASCPDGTSNTIAIGERFARCGTTNSDWEFADHYCIDINDNVIPCVNPLNRRASFADPAYDDVLPVTRAGITQPSVAGISFQVAPTPSACNYRVLQTSFSGGMLVALLDGSVRTVSPSISPQTFWSAVTPASGDILGTDW